MMEKSDVEKQLDGSRREAERLVAKVHGLSAELEAARRAKARAHTNLGTVTVIPLLQLPLPSPNVLHCVLLQLPLPPPLAVSQRTALCTAPTSLAVALAISQRTAL